MQRNNVTYKLFELSFVMYSIYHKRRKGHENLRYFDISSKVRRSMILVIGYLKRIQTFKYPQQNVTKRLPIIDILTAQRTHSHFPPNINARNSNRRTGKFLFLLQRKSGDPKIRTVTERYGKRMK